MPSYRSGEHLNALSLNSINLGEIRVPPVTANIMHLQFRRFAGCPVCNLHLHSFIQRHAELQQADIQEVAVFHSSQKSLLKHHAKAPFALIADPDKELYRAFGVESSITSVIHPRTWLPMLRGALRYGVSLPEAGEKPLGLPADFLINQHGKIIACKYGKHAEDHWSVDEVLHLATQTMDC